MPKSTQQTARPKAQETLAAPRYVSGTAIKSMNSYEKMLLRQEQAAKAVRMKLMRTKMALKAGALRCLFSTVH